VRLDPRRCGSLSQAATRTVFGRSIAELKR
jgi:hypothetical protein